jgi:hypothetical protein
MNRLGYIGCVVADPFKVFDAKQDLSAGDHIMDDPLCEPLLPHTLSNRLSNQTQVLRLGAWP